VTDDVLIIGGGLAGLACGVALADRGLRCHVLEASERLGGRASSWNDQATGDTVDIGPHIVHSEYHNMLAFLERLGTAQQITWQPGKVLALASKPRPVHLRHAPLPPPMSLIASILPAPGLHRRQGPPLATGDSAYPRPVGRRRVRQACPVHPGQANAWSCAH
jgi:uncharacterized protein with NAD-binding domain and iron-sulfur cluster